MNYGANEEGIDGARKESYKLDRVSSTITFLNEKNGFCG